MSKWHNLEVKRIEEILATNLEKGLPFKEVLLRQKKFGKNKIVEKERFIALKTFLNQFKNPLIYLLLIAGFALLIFKNFTDSLVIFGAVFINVIFGFFEEFKISKTLRALTSILKTKAIVKREGRIFEIDQENLVVGDIIILKAGNKVPADGRLIKAENLKINESILSGEWLPAEKTLKILPEDTPLQDRDNMVFMGTLIQEGRGEAIVVEIGKNTQYGKIAKLVKETKKELSPLEKKLKNFSQKIAIIIGLICLFIFVGEIFRERNFLKALETSVAVAVGGIPEALPIVMTLIFTIGAKKILKEGGLIKKLSAIETLGSCHIIATDKTRTLTEGKMKLEKLIGKEKEVLEVAVICADFFIENPDYLPREWIVKGSPTDKAIVEGAIKKKIFKEDFFEKIKIIKKWDFDPSLKSYLSLFQKEKKFYLGISGAPEKILSLSKNKNKVKKQLSILLEEGKRVIGVAKKEIKNLENFSLKDEIKSANFEFLGLISLEDPLRKDVRESLNLAKKAGIETLIVTGDHQKTAELIAKKLGFVINKENVLNGAQLEKISEKDFFDSLSKIKVFARVEPKHKIKIVEGWQKKNKVIAMIGDGINDAPALKKADIGVSVGSGTEVAKESAELILLNDSFKIIVKAIEQGRVILDNLRKSASYILADSFASAFLIGVSVIFGWPLPILPTQILFNNIVEDTFPTFAFAFEPKEKDVMKRKPRGPQDPFLNKEMKILIFFTGLIDQLLILILFWVLWQKLKFDLKVVRTIIFGTLSIDTAFVIFAYKNLRKNIWQINPFSNKFLPVCSFLVLIIFSIAIYTPFFQKLLSTAPLKISHWLIIIGTSLSSLGLIELTKWYFICKKKNLKKPPFGG